MKLGMGRGILLPMGRGAEEGLVPSSEFFSIFKTQMATFWCIQVVF